MARTEVSLHRASDIVLRIRGHQPRKTPTWFALAEDRPLFGFAGLWTPWRGASQERAGRRAARAVRLPDDRSQRDHRADPSQGDAGYSDIAGRVRSLARRTNARGAEVATAIAGRCAQDRGERRERGPRARGHHLALETPS